MVENLQNIFMEHNIIMIFGIKDKCIIDPYNVLLAIATNILMTAFVLQRQIYLQSQYKDIHQL